MSRHLPKVLAFAAFAVLAAGIGLWDHLSYEHSFVELDRTVPTEAATAPDVSDPDVSEPAVRDTSQAPVHTPTQPLTDAPERTLPETAPDTVPPETAGITFPLELNAASFGELCAIPGVGEVTAQHILDYRDRAGGFSALEELLEVPGIGEARYAAMLPYLWLDVPEAPLPADDPTEAEETAAPETLPAPSPETLPQTDEATLPPAPETAPPMEAETVPVTDVPEIPTVDLNSADASQLCALPGCDEVLAERIVTLRGEIGRFSNILEVCYAEGVTPSLYLQWEPYLVLDEEGNTVLPRYPETVSPA